MGNLSSLNLEYIILRIYDAFSGVQGIVSGIPRYVIIVTGDISTVGMVIAALFFIAVVYLQIRLVQVEHAGYAFQEEERRRRQEHAEHVGINSRWDAVVGLASSPNEGDWRRAILEADIMLADLLTNSGYQGDTIADQLRNANRLQFTTLDLAWEAHKVRNAVAHLGEAFPLTERDVHSTMDLYRRVFEEFSVV